MPREATLLQLADAIGSLWPRSVSACSVSGSVAGVIRRTVFPDPGAEGRYFTGDRADLRDRRDSPDLAGAADEDLVRLSQAGNRAAFTQIVERYKDRVHWLVRRMIGGSEDEDITQEVFLRAYQAMPRLRSGATLRTWLFKIAHNLCVTELARRARRADEVSLDEAGEEKIHHLLPHRSGEITERVERKDFARAVQALVARLAPQYRTVLTLYYVQEVKYEEIAEITGLPLGTVKTHLRRARLRLRDLVLSEMEKDL
jgi:RNA polymerase sigma-70 factor (ECF subfamily)